MSVVVWRGVGRRAVVWSDGNYFENATSIADVSQPSAAIQRQIGSMPGGLIAG